MSTIVAPVALAIKAVAAAVASDPPVQAFWPAPPRLEGAGPFGVVEAPRLTRTAVDERERELGSDDWHLAFPVVFYVDLRDPSTLQRDQLRALDLLEAFIRAIDANPSLGDVTIDDTKVVTGDPFIQLETAARPLFAYECEVQVWRRVPTV